MRKYRVLYIATSSGGGANVCLYRLAKGLKDSQYEPVVLFYTRQDSYVREQLAECGIKVLTLEDKLQGPVLRPDAAAASGVEGPPLISTSFLPTARQRRDIGGWLETHFGKLVRRAYVSLKACYRFLHYDVPKIWPIVRAIRAYDVDLVHFNNSLLSSKAGIIAARLTKKPCVCHVRQFHELNPFDTAFGRFVDTFAYMSSALAESYTTHGISPAKGVVVLDGVDLNEFAHDFDVAAVRSEFGWTVQDPIVGVVGRLDWWKGHEYFLEAVAKAAHQIPNLKGLIVGAPQSSARNQAYYQELQSLTRSLGLEDRVVFTGFRSDVPRLMSAMDVVVLPSSNPEPFGLVVIEGMAAGKPVVATAAGGPVDIIEDGISGRLVPCKDARTMAAAIVELLSDPEKARRIGQAARRRVETAFNVDKHVAAIQTLYETILSTDRPGGRAPRTQVATQAGGQR
jgi:glycosyltransferase involved in cell wall biosynthesis